MVHHILPPKQNQCYSVQSTLSIRFEIEIMGATSEVNKLFKSHTLVTYSFKHMHMVCTGTPWLDTTVNVQPHSLGMRVLNQTSNMFCLVNYILVP